jgi:hypothetical protein
VSIHPLRTAVRPNSRDASAAELRAPHLEEERLRAELLRRKLYPSQDEPGYIYLLQSPRSGALKLGFTLNVKRRLEKLSYEYDEALTLVDWIPGTKGDEDRLGLILRPHLLPYKPGHGVEWYRNARAVRESLSSIEKLRKVDLEKVPRASPLGSGPNVARRPKKKR